MRLLVLGGTAWLGHEVAATAIANGHEVTCLARGTAVPKGARLVHADRDDDNAIVPLTTAWWDAVIDVATEPGHVRNAVRDLERVATHYLFVSTGNVYASQERIGVDESAERMLPLDTDKMTEPDDYGPAKVACENAVLAAFGADRSLIARSGLIAGPGDPTGRTDYWPWRFAYPAHPGEVLVPDAPELPAALIDVRDLASWLVRCTKRRTAGIFNAMGPTVTFPEHIEAARQAARSDALAVAAPEGWLLERGVREWSGPRSMPLWLADRSWYGMNSRCIDRARAAGLTFRPLVETLRDGLGWRQTQADSGARGAGLTDADERELLASFATTAE